MAIVSASTNPKRRILADYDDQGIYVYQAFSDYTGKHAIHHKAFIRGLGFNRQRMTWIKPSLAWALYRSGYATKDRQTVLLRIKVSHEGFLSILSQSVLAEYEETMFHSTKDEWRRLLAKYPGRVQWDPARDYDINRKLDYRAIQIGLGGDLPNHYAEDWIQDIEDFTPLAHEIHTNILAGKQLPELPKERVYPIHSNLATQLNMD